MVYKQRENYPPSGHRVIKHDPRVAQQKRPIYVQDTRSLTAQVFGDPIPDDPRRPWLKNKGKNLK